MGRYLLLNLADPVGSGSGAFNAMARGIEAKRRPETKKKVVNGNAVVETIDLFPILASEQQRQLDGADIRPIRIKCQTAAKIYLATHGTPSDTGAAFSAASGGAVLCSCSQLAFLMLKLLPERNEQYNLALIMCYGARSENYRAATLNHQGQLEPADLKTSFAYKFFRSICMFRNVRMTARTGAVQFTGKGKSLVEQEIAIDARSDKDEYLHDAELLKTITAWQAEKKRCDKDMKLFEAWQALNDKFKTDPAAAAADDNEKMVKEYQTILRTKGGFQKIQDENPDLAKCGKIIYTFDVRRPGAGLTIINKYGDSTQGTGPEHVLYQGPLI